MSLWWSRYEVEIGMKGWPCYAKFVRFQPEALELYSLGASGSLMHLALNHTQPTTNTFAAILHNIPYTPLELPRLEQTLSNIREKKIDQT